MVLPYFKKYGDSSGGSLNDICETSRIASRKNSISVITLQENHKIFSPEHLLEEIDRYFHEDCSCGLKSATTIEELGKKLWDLQETTKGKAILASKNEEKWDLETCNHWMRNLMGKNSFRGKRMEDAAIKKLKEQIWKYTIEKADEETDISYGVDLVIKKSKDIIGGIQVKPDTFSHHKYGYVKKIQENVSYPVYDLIYDKDGNWKNYLSVISNFL